MLVDERVFSLERWSEEDGDEHMTEQDERRTAKLYYKQSVSFGAETYLHRE